MSKQQTFGRSRPSVAYELEYRRALQKICGDMEKDVKSAINSYLKAEMAADASLSTLTQIMKELRKKWYKVYRERGKALADWLSKKTDKRTANQIRRKLKQFGFTVKPTYTKAQEAVIKDITTENAQLITTIPQVYLRTVQRAVTRTFKRGQDVAKLTERIHNILKALGEENRNRAALIARDQNQKVTQAFAIENAKAVGANKGKWIHVPGKYSSRITHIKMNGKTFNLDEGMYDSEVGRFVKPGELIYCNCQFSVLMPGFDE